MNNPNFAIQKYVTGSDIKRVRKTLRLTQKKFAELVGVSKATMERWETKEDKITGPVVLLLKILEDHPEYVTKIQIPDKKYGLRMWYMHEQEICTLIDVDELRKRVRIKNYTDNIMFQAFGNLKEPTYEDYEVFLESRCFPKSRDKMKLILKDLDLPFYDPLMIIQKTEAAMQRIAREHLPENIGLEWSGLSYQEKKAGGQTGFVLALVFLFVFLFLAAQYESWIVPIAVLLSLPVAALGAYLGIWVTGLHNDIYFQIGLVTLIGLAAKNAILIVEFAKIQVDSGVEVVKAALHAARMRFRPILMTSLAFVLGMLPMVLASGPGSASRHSIGTGVFFGMLVAITVGIVLVPFFFVLIYKIKGKVRMERILHRTISK